MVRSGAELLPSTVDSILDPARKGFWALLQAIEMLTVVRQHSFVQSPPQTAELVALVELAAVSAHRFLKAS